MATTDPKYATAEALADSTLGEGRRIVSLLIRYPKCIDAEVLTHRMSAKNSQSSRAIGAARVLGMLDDEASRFVPLLRREKKGMTDAGEMNNPAAEAKARELILEHCKRTAELIKELEALAIHHQIANRYAEPFLFTTRVMTSAIEWWRHFIRLRKSPEAEPHMQLLAAAIEEAIDSSRPIKTDVHVPFKPTSLLITDTEFIAPAMLAKAIKGLPVIEQAVAKCARISYLNYDKQFTPQEDAAFVERLWQNEHRSPFEHVCVSRAAFPEMANEPSCMGANWLTLRQVMERYAN